MNRGFTQHQSNVKKISGVRFHSIASRLGFGAGFTMVETVFVVGLTVFLLFAMQSLYFSFIRLASEESAEYAARASAGGVLRTAENIVLPADRVLASHTFSTGTYTTGAETLVVRIPAIDAAGTIVPAVYDYAVIYQSGSSALLRIEASPRGFRQTRERTIGSSVTDLTFSYNNADVTQATSVTTDINVATSDGHGTSILSLEETFRIRNLSL